MSCPLGMINPKCEQLCNKHCDEGGIYRIDTVKDLKAKIKHRQKPMKLISRKGRKSC